jgi:hypothetical protein
LNPRGEPTTIRRRGDAAQESKKSALPEPARASARSTGAGQRHVGFASKTVAKARADKQGAVVETIPGKLPA